MSEYPELYILWCKDCGKVPKIKIIFPEGTGNDVKINYTCQCENNKEISIKDFINLFRHEIIFEGKYCELCYRDYMKESEKNKELEKYKIRDKKGFTCPFCYNYYCEDDKIYHFIQSKHKDNFLCTQAIKEKEKEEEEEKKEEEKKEEEKKEEEKKEEEKKEEEKKEEEKKEEEKKECLPKNNYCEQCNERICDKCKKKCDDQNHITIENIEPPKNIKPLENTFSIYLEELQKVGKYLEGYKEREEYKSFDECNNNFTELIKCFQGTLIFFNDKERYIPQSINNVKEITLKINQIQNFPEEKIKDYMLNFNERIKIVSKYAYITQKLFDNIIIRNIEKEEEEEKQIKNNVYKEFNINEILNNYKIYDGSHQDFIRSVRCFKKSKKIISISDDQSISIWKGDDEVKEYKSKFQHLQTLDFVHANLIFDLCLYEDENNEKIITCSNDQTIKIHSFNPKTNLFELEETIVNAHDNDINRILCVNGIIISCSDDKTIKFWNNNNQQRSYQCFQTLTQNLKIEGIKIDNKNSDNVDPEYYNQVQNIFLCEYKEKYILFSSGYYGTRKWTFDDNKSLVKDFNSKSHYFDMKDVQCLSGETVKLLYNKYVIFGGSYDLNQNQRYEIKIIDLEKENENYIFYVLEIPFVCKGLLVKEDLDFFFVVGTSSKILRYRTDNFICLDDEEKVNERGTGEHQRDINGLTELDDNTIISFSDDRYIKIWNLIKVGETTKSN